MTKPLPAPVRQAGTLLQACLADRGAVRARAMFGGYGIYLDDQIFALWLSGLFLKVDAVSKPLFDVEGLPPFQYTKENGTVTSMSYHRVSDAWDSPESLGPWVNRAVEAAKRSAKSRKK